MHSSLVFFNLIVSILLVKILLLIKQFQHFLIGFRSFSDSFVSSCLSERAVRMCFILQPRPHTKRPRRVLQSRHRSLSRYWRWTRIMWPFTGDQDVSAMLPLKAIASSWAVPATAQITERKWVWLRFKPSNLYINLDNKYQW